MAFGQLSPDILQAITIAVQTTGLSALADFQAQLARVETEINNYKQALSQGIIPATEFLQKTNELIAKQRDLQAAVHASTNVLKGVPAGFRLSGQAALSLSYALDDLQYGFSAIVNNAPHIALALGAGPGVAGALGTLFVVLNQLSKHLPDTAGMFRTLGRDLGLLNDPAKTASDSIAGIEARIAAVNDKPFKLQGDYDELRKLAEAAKVAAAEMSHLDALRLKKSEPKSQAAKAVDDALTESGATKPLQKILLDEMRKRVDPGSTHAVDFAYYQKQVDQANDAIKQFGAYSPIGTAAMAGRALAGNKLAEVREAMEKENIGKVAEMFALGGGERSRKQLEEAVARPDVGRLLEQQGVDMLRLQAGIANAAPDRVMEDERRKIAQATEKKDAAKQHALDVERARARAEMERDMDLGAKQLAQEGDRAAKERESAVKEQARRVGPAFDDKLEAAFYEHGRAGGDVAATAKDARKEVIASLRTRDVPEDLVASVADAILEKARESALNKLGSGQQPRLVREKETADDAEKRRGTAALQKQWREATRGPANWGYHAQQFQNETGVDDVTAQQAGKEIGGLIDKGTNPALAYKQVFDKIHRVFLKNLATQGDTMEIMAAATQQLAQMDMADEQLRANIGAVKQNLRRNQVQRQSLQTR